MPVKWTAQLRQADPGLEKGGQQVFTEEPYIGVFCPAIPTHL